MRALPILLLLALPCPAPAADLSGCWPQGYWRECRSGHSGPLRAEFTRVCDGRYRVVFRGRFALILPFRYAVDLDVVGERDGKVLLSGPQRLPLFGVFNYSAEATETEFRATFQSRRDSGEFVLGRCR
jgi:hypothetical protein